MNYDVNNINKKLLEEIKGRRFSIESFAELVGTSRQTLSNWLKSDMPLSTFIKICKLLQLEPSTFFLQNNGNLNNAINSKNVAQSIGQNDLQKELLIQENKHLKEKIELLERLVNASKS